MTANVKIEVEEHVDVLRVPNAALRFRPPGSKAATGADSGGSRLNTSAPGGAGEAAERVNRLIEPLTWMRTSRPGANHLGPCLCCLPWWPRSPCSLAA